MEEMKTCRRCGATKSLRGFALAGHGKRKNVCHACKDNRFMRPRRVKGEGGPRLGRWPKIKDSVLLWKEKHQDRVAVMDSARSAVKAAIRNGKLVRPSECENCGASNTLIEAAHFNYVELLRVRWLCRPCHRQWDRSAPKST